MTTTLLSTAYLAPIQYYSKLTCYKHVIIEQWENYQKQSFRNRCVIASANGPLTLSIPIERSEKNKCLIKDVKIEYRTNWQKLHFKAIESAYKNAPFYLYYIDDIVPFLATKTTFLFDFNIALQESLLKSLEIKPNLILSDEYLFSIKENMVDYRNTIHPKEQKITMDNRFSAKKYPQVFDGKFEFVPNLSIIDLLFNTGPDAKDIICKSYIS